MEVTKDNLIKLYERAQQVFIAKTGHKPNSIEFSSDGSFNCYYSYPISYGGTEVIHRRITHFHLNQDLDEIIEQRKAKEARDAEDEKIKNEKNKIDRDRKDKEQRRLQFEKLKKEFEG